MNTVLYRAKVLKNKSGDKKLLITFTALNNSNGFNGLIEKIYHDDYNINAEQTINVIKSEMLALDYKQANYNFVNINDLIYKGF